MADFHEMVLTQRIKRVNEIVPVAGGDGLALVVRLVRQDSSPTLIIPDVFLVFGFAQRLRHGQVHRISAALAFFPPHRM